VNKELLEIEKEEFTEDLAIEVDSNQARRPTL
jgi:hypothetical protein